MHLIEWCGFLGAWLLFAGPIYQASIELAEEDVEREAIPRAVESIGPMPRVSPWWWLLPPVMYAKRRRIGRAYRDQMMRAIPHDDLESLVSFQAKSTGWLLVGLGGLLIASKETWELVEAYEWPHAVFWVLVVVMAYLAILHTVWQVRRVQGLMELNSAESATNR